MRLLTPVMGVVSVVIVMACGGVSPARAAAADEEITLAPGRAQRVAKGGVTLRFDRVVSDSRCPSDARCIRAGWAEVAITLSRDGASVQRTLSLGEQRESETDYEGCIVALVKLEPYPTTSDTIPPDDYRATFRVTSANAEPKNPD